MSSRLCKKLEVRFFQSRLNRWEDGITDPDESTRKQRNLRRREDWTAGNPYAADKLPDTRCVDRPWAASSRSAARSTACLASGRLSAGITVMVFNIPASSK